eukprot:TRINITY_DN1549_c0_g1_i1.p1 TRINITY_DN1549_c0_g1~~TRINITY_DN1549_c0_g1_i1.p1  ORF type:complete len:482 (-),score=70.72 TRINITY_DN1549_c0_g1_i1:32-1477(-)
MNAIRQKVFGEWVGSEAGVEYLGGEDDPVKHTSRSGSKTTSFRGGGSVDRGADGLSSSSDSIGFSGDYESHPSLTGEQEEYIILSSEDEGNQIASPAGCAFNLINNIIGGGVLALPFTLKTSGLVLGPFLLVGVGLLSAYSAFLLLLAGRGRVGPSYRSLAEECLGRYGGLVVDLCMILFLFGALTGYLIIIGDVLTPFMDFLGRLETREFVVAVVAVFVILPLCLLPRVDYLKYASLAALGCIFYIVVVIVIRGAEEIDAKDKAEDIAIVPKNMDVLQSIPIISFAFTFHASLFPVFSEMRRPTMKRVGGVIIVSNLICAAAYLAVAIFGYITFMEDTEGNIFDNYVDDDLLEAGKGVLAGVIILSYPLIHYPARIHFDNILTSTLGEDRLPDIWIRHVGIPFIYLGSTYVLSIIIPDITVVFGFVGATAGNAIVFVIPAIAYVKLANPGLWPRIAAVTLAVMGVVIGVASVVALAIDLF